MWIIKRQRECVHSPMSGIIKRTANFISRKDKRDDKDRKVRRKKVSLSVVLLITDSFIPFIYPSPNNYTSASEIRHVMFGIVQQL